MMNNIANLSDFATLKKLSMALWQQGSSYNGAAVMVGAGFSRVAAFSGDAQKKLPLWGDISKLLAAEIGSSGQTDSLRLAEEYRAYFGQQAMLDVLKKIIHDEAWMPGALYKDLLELPWSEVLTTNWDTLLERASADVHHPIYSVVHHQEDLASTRTPRIVKLHGTFGINDELIFTQEDFRKYPQRHAAFVNLARQVFIENELCLLGFSGDDPNFLQWAGWVRDHLASHARRIYLVGALNLTAAKRKYLESINVAPIDLSPLVAEYDDQDAKHAAATKAFLEVLRTLRPKPTWEWMPTRLRRTVLTSEEITKTDQDDAYAAKLLEEQVTALEVDRMAYPGWIACPPSVMFQLQCQIGDPFPTSKRLAAMRPESRAKLLYEMAWRYGVTYEVPQPWIVQELLAICDPDKPCALTKKQQLEIALLLLKCSRWLDGVEAASIDQTTSAILVKGEKYWTESANELAYHRAIVARDRFDYVAIEKNVGELETSDPVWKLRKACLMAELGQFGGGKLLIAEAYRELLTQHRKDKNSIHVMSRLAWAHWLMRGVNFLMSGDEFKAFPSIYHDRKCDPAGSIEHVAERISKTLETLRKQRGIRPSFEPGTYRDNSKTITFSNQVHPLLLLDGISRTVGMPISWGHVNFLVEPVAKVAELEDLEDKIRFTLAIRSASSEASDVLKDTFSRIRVACVSAESAAWLLNQCAQAIDYWSAKLTGGPEDVQTFAVERLRIFLEVLGRISVRATVEKAGEILKKGFALGRVRAFQHFWLSEPLGDLIDNAIKSIPNERHHEVLSEALHFPLQTEIHAKNGMDRWPNPEIKFPGKRSANPAVDRRIDEVIDCITPAQAAPALLRLLPLLDAGFLTAAETKKIGEKIWGPKPAYRALPETGLLPHALLELPAPSDAAARDVVRRYLFDAQGDRLFDQFLLTGIVGAAGRRKCSERPSPQQALAYFGRMTSWRAKEGAKDPFGISDDKEKEIGAAIGKALAYAIVPALPAEAINQDNFDKLLAFHTAAKTPVTVMALPRFAASNELFAGTVEKIIRQGLQDKDPNKLASSAFALMKWREMGASPAVDGLVSRLVYLLGVNLAGGLPALLSVAREMYTRGYLSVDQSASLEDAVSLIFDSANYKSIDPSGREAVSISLVRVECVRLAKAFVDRNQSSPNGLARILSEAKGDPLPEVRFADSINDGVPLN